MERKLVRDTFFKFFTTSLASSLTLSILSMTDLMIAGHAVGDMGLTAVSLALPVVSLVQIAAALGGTGGAIVFSARLGEGDLDACSRVFTLSLVGALVSSLVLSALGLLNLPALVHFFGASGEAETELASTYIRILLMGLPVMILSPVMVTFLRNDSHQEYSMICVITGALLNVICSLGFSIGLGWGIAGIGMATVFSQMVSCLMAGVKLLNGRRSYGLTRGFFSGQLVGEILTPGSVVALIFFCQVLLTVIINRILNTDSEGGAAVYAVVKYLINFLFALFDGVTGAVQPMLGIYYGERERENIHYTAIYAFRTMMVMAALMCLFLEMGGPLLCVLFGVESPSVAAMTVTAARIIGVYCFGAAVVTFLNSFYRCVGREQFSFLLGLADNLVFPLAAILFFVRGLSMGGMGVCGAIGSAAVFTILLWCVIARPWKNGVLLLAENQFPVAEGEYRCIAPANMEEAGRILSEVEEYCEKTDISMKRQYYINLAIEELIVNVVGLAEADSRQLKKKRHSGIYYADVRISPMEDGSVRLRIRDNLTEWTPAALKEDGSSLVELDEGASVNELGIGLIKKIASSYSYRRTIGFNNFSVIL